MALNEKGKQEMFDFIAKQAEPLVKLLNDYYNPHCTILVTQQDITIVEDICYTKVEYNKNLQPLK